MLGTKIVLNEEKILREKKYDIVELYDLIDNFAENLGFTKESRKDNEQMLLNHILNTDCISQSISVANRATAPLLVT